MARNLASAGRALAVASLALGALRFVQARQPLAMGLAFPKLVAAALGPEVATLGVVGAALHLAERLKAGRGGSPDVPLTLAAALVGAGLAVRSVRESTAPHDAFDGAFGADWRSRIRPDLLARLPSHRWSLVLDRSAKPRVERGVVVDETPLGGRPLTADLWRPGAGVTPSGLAFVYVNVGGWQMISPDFIVGTLLGHLAGQGHVVLNVAPRVPPANDLAGMVGDTMRGIAWMKANAARLGARADRVVIGGSSAGGHLALLAAYAPNAPALTPPDLASSDLSVRGVVSFYGPTDLAAYYAHNRNAAQIRMLLGGLPTERPDEARRGSPISYVGSHCPPTLLFQGEHDSGVPATAARALAGRLGAVGVPAAYVEFPGAEHAFDFILPRLSPAVQAELYDLDWFLALLAG